MRYLPSLVVFVVLCVCWVIADSSQLQVLETNKRDGATRILRNIQTQLNHYISRSLRVSRKVARQIDPGMEIDQQSFESIVEEFYDGPADISRVELAPDFVTQYVYPRDGNESYIGVSPLREPVNGRPRLVSDVERGFPFLAAIKVSKSGVGELQVRSEIREVREQKVISNGVLHMVLNFELHVADPMNELPAGDVEFLYLVSPAGAPTPDLPQDWQNLSPDLEPATYNLRVPPGDILLFAKPVKGWRPELSQTVSHRLQYALLALSLLLPVVLANWFAISRGTTRVDLSKTRQQMRGLLKTLPGAAFTYTSPSESELGSDKDSVRFLNPKSCLEVFGVDSKIAEENVSTLWDIIETPDSKQKVSEALLSSMQSMQTFDYTWPIVTPDGESKWLQCRAEPIRLQDGSTQWSALVFDNTEGIISELELEAQRAVAFRAQKLESIGQLTGGVAHDFNNLLAVVVANLEWISSEELSESQKECLQDAIDATEMGAELTSNMLSFAKRARLTPEIISLNDVVDAAGSLLARTLPASVSVRYYLDDEISHVSADRGSTESALLNLVLNAKDAMDDQGLLTVSTTTVMIHENETDSHLSELSAGSYTVLSVSDTGPGVSSEHLEHIFEPFYTTKAPGEGSGLGLSMIIGFMQQSGGAVKVATEKNKGTTISLYFPAVSAAQRTKKTQNYSRATGGRVLFAEDNVSVRNALVRVLNGYGYDVVPTSSGDEALQVFKSQSANFDLVITDMVMPGKLQGPALASAIREIEPGFAVIFLSGYSDAPVQNSSKGVWLKKPIKSADLINAIEMVKNSTVVADVTNNIDSHRKEGSVKS